MAFPTLRRASEAFAEDKSRGCPVRMEYLHFLRRGSSFVNRFLQVVRGRFLAVGEKSSNFAAD